MPDSYVRFLGLFPMCYLKPFVVLHFQESLGLSRYSCVSSPMLILVKALLM